MKITEMLLTPNQYSRPQKPLTNIKNVVWHYVGNPKSTAQNNRDYFESLKNTKATYVSSHYVVGLEGEVIRCIPENEWAYCSNKANAYSISIEVCHPDKTGKFNAVTEQSLIELTAEICKRHNLDPMTDIIRHYDVTGKLCPLWYVDYPADFVKAKERVKALLSEKLPTSTRYEIVFGTFSKEEDARIASEFLRNRKFYADRPEKVDGGWRVRSYDYADKAKADEIQSIMLETFKIYGEVKVRK